MNTTTQDIGIALQGYIPVRKDPFERAEMVTQVLFGETVQIEDEEGAWLYVKLHKDGYEGWIDRKCIEISTEIPEQEYIVTRRNIRIRNITDNHPVVLPIGAAIPAVSEGNFVLGNKQYLITEIKALAKPGSIEFPEIFGEVISIPYIWGGRSGFGFDCSGLTQFLCRMAGHEIPRDASEQSAIGKTLSFLEEAVTGDLAFFDNPEGMIHHVGMMIETDRIIHASGRVRIDRIDQQGIYNEQLGRYTHKLRVLKRI